jgi:hypothetical protein
MLGVVSGLVAHRDKVRSAFSSKPDVLGLGVSDEALDGLRHYPTMSDEQREEIGLSGLDEIYLYHLARYGPVRFPCPAYLMAVRIADRRGLRVIPLDMDEDAFEDAYSRHVSTWEFISSGSDRRHRRLRRKRFPEAGASSFCLTWDRVTRGSRGFARLERDRESAMAASLVSELRKGTRVLSVMEVARARGVLDRVAGGGV